MRPLAGQPRVYMYYTNHAPRLVQCQKIVTLLGLA